MNDLLTKRNVIIWVLVCFMVASLYAALTVSISNRIAASAVDARQRADEQAKAHAGEIAWQAHLTHAAWQRAHPAEYARQKAAANAAQRRREVAAENARRAIAAKQRAEDDARAAAHARKDAEEASLFHGTPDCLVLDKRTLTTEAADYTWYIKGKVINQCDRSFGYAQVEFAFYDIDGNKTASGLVNINNLEAGQTWYFKKPVYETQSAGKWNVSGLSAF